MLRVLLRTGTPFFGSWGIEMLVLQLYDKVKAVAMEALTVLSEACEEEVSGGNCIHGMYPWSLKFKKNKLKSANRRRNCSSTAIALCLKFQMLSFYYKK